MFEKKMVFPFVFVTLFLSSNGAYADFQKQVEKRIEIEKYCVETVSPPKKIRKKGMSMREMHLMGEKAQAEYEKKLNECISKNLKNQ